jgi:mRNA-degrading endonuclease RelE of RelBE toxin-antitoxin system
MKKYMVKIDPDALNDIQMITNWYNEQQKGLGGRFQKTTIQQINSLKKDPHIYAIRYNEIRCMSIKKFPYMIHFFINDENNTVEVLAVINTDRNPKVWEEKTSRQ